MNYLAEISIYFCFSIITQNIAMINVAKNIRGGYN